MIHALAEVARNLKNAVDDNMTKAILLFNSISFLIREIPRYTQNDKTDCFVTRNDDARN